MDLREFEQLCVRGMFVVERDLDWEPVVAQEVKLPGNPFGR